MRRAFTLIEVLVVVAIIALLVSILVPSLSRAREQARIASCMSNTSQLVKGVFAFAAAHRGLAQAVMDAEETPVIDPNYSKYAYQTNAFNRAGQYLKPWPVAYASELGAPTIKRMEQLFTQGFSDNPADYSKLSRMDVLLCPSDKRKVATVFFPFQDLFGLLSYAANEDVFGVTRPLTMSSQKGEGQPWKDGQSGDSATSIRAARLAGKLDAIIRPSEVALFADGGSEDKRTREQILNQPPYLLTNQPGTLRADIRGGYLQNYERTWGRLPIFRHTNRGGVAVGMADGSARYAKPIRFKVEGGVQYVELYNPQIRVTPYNVGNLIQPQP